jgi:catechol 2,3-dioxygenase-like lactoylglutathione lyase family enzyme
LITGFSHSTIWVLDQDEALEFYTEKLGFELNTDATMDDFRWLTVNAPDRPEHELVLAVPGPPMMDEESAEQVKALVAKARSEQAHSRRRTAERRTQSSVHAASPFSRSRPSASTASRRPSATTPATGSA